MITLFRSVGEGKIGQTTVPRTGETNRSPHFSEQRLMSKNCRGGGGGGGVGGPVPGYRFAKT